MNTSPGFGAAAGGGEDGRSSPSGGASVTAARMGRRRSRSRSSLEQPAQQRVRLTGRRRWQRRQMEVVFTPLAYHVRQRLYEPDNPAAGRHTGRHVRSEPRAPLLRLLEGEFVVALLGLLLVRQPLLFH